jgi:hypothetical protein
MYTILFDGAPLVWKPNGSAALHLLSLLAHRPRMARVRVALPGDPIFPLPEDIQSVQVNTPSHDWGALTWEQRVLPRLAHNQHADLLHITAKYAPLFGRAMTVLSPTEPFEEQNHRSRRSLGERLRLATGQGGRARARAGLWPADLPLPMRLQDSPMRMEQFVKLPPCVHPAFTEAAIAPDLELPEDFILYHGPLGERSLQRLLSAWSWAAAAIGEATMLLILGADLAQKQRVGQLARENGLLDSVWALPLLPLEGLAWLYQHCRAVFHPAPIGPWDGAMRLGLACGRPLVGLETPLADALVGPAAYLVTGEQEGPAQNRALGAALITVMVEESVSMALEEVARQRSGAWQAQDFRQALDAAYQGLLDERH